jgi:hypothetical protein
MPSSRSSGSCALAYLRAGQCAMHGCTMDGKGGSRIRCVADVALRAAANFAVLLLWRLGRKLSLLCRCCGGYRWLCRTGRQIRSVQCSACEGLRLLYAPHSSG